MEAAAVELEVGSAFWAWAAGVEETLKSFAGLAALDLGLAALCVFCCSSVPGSLKAVWNSLRSFLTSLGISTFPSLTPLQISSIFVFSFANYDADALHPFVRQAALEQWEEPDS